MSISERLATKVNVGSIDLGFLNRVIINDVTLYDQQNRLMLRNIMIQNGFAPVQGEWWHFTLRNEPYPNTYFDFTVKKYQ